ncbi:unnamed protein product [Diabrotica balteata]|uniref:Uncharacterized protein n=1 Tax=Diabrotica balteata TaxID=107213 RepID=A0A9N9T7X5_DIABA|nr:unnamed protein product [Diabrotica balteata]
MCIGWNILLHDIRSKVAADIHKNSDGAVLANRRLTIPHEIRETIDALKIARPLQSSPRRNRRHLVRSVSDTSCDKETCCNFLGADLAKFDNKDNRSSLVDVFSKPTKLKNVSKFPQHRKLSPEVNMMELSLNMMGEQLPNIKETNANVDDQSVESKKNPKLKWKIVINKHKAYTSDLDKK